MIDPPLDRRGTLRSRLVKLEGELTEKLTREDIDGGFMAMLGQVGAALDALDRMPVEAEPAVQAVVSDDGTRIRLTLYSEAGAEAAVALTPIRAIALAGRLIAAASLRLSR
jgi:hypothetical protein